MNEQEIRDQLRGWILERAGAPPDKELDGDTPILDSGLLSSLDVLELILFIESLRGDEVDVEAIEPEVITSIDTLFDAFFAERVTSG